MTHLLAFLETLLQNKERKISLDALFRSLTSSPKNPFLIIWIKDDGEVLDAFGGAIRRIGFKRWKKHGPNMFKVYPQIEPFVKQCVRGQKPIQFDFCGENVRGKDFWLKCFMLPILGVDFKVTVSFCFDISRYKFADGPLMKIRRKSDITDFQIQYNLTDAEVKICKLLSIGNYSYKQAADILKKSTYTLSSQMRIIRKKLGIKSKKRNTSVLIRELINRY